MQRRIPLLLSALVLGMLVPLQAPAVAATGTGDADLVDLGLRWAAPAASGLRTSAPIDLPDDTTVVGADWGGDESTVVSVRTRSDGVWSDWQPVHADEEEGPDTDSAEAAASTTWSAPIVVAGTDEIQFRSPTTAVRVTGVVVEEGSGSGSVAAQATGPSGAPDHVTRAQWGADESIVDPEVPTYAETVRFAVLHHTAGSNSYSRSQSAGIVRGIFEYHVRSRGWSDIGYNVLIDRHGQVFEGRKGGLDRAVEAAHAAGFNSGSTGIALMGDFTNTAVPAAARESLEDFLAWKFTQHHVDPTGVVTEVAGNGSRFTEGRDVTLPRVVGHRDVGYTSCPGSLHDVIENGSLQRAVLARMQEQVFTDVPDRPWASVVGEPTPITARTNDRANWQVRIVSEQGDTLVSRRFTNTSAIDTSWDHKRANGAWVDQGVYDIVLDATLTDGTKLPTVRIPLELGLGLPEWRPVTGDWNGDGTTDRGWWNNGRWVLESGKDVIAFHYGRDHDAPIVGDWDADGADEIGIIRDREWHLRDEFAGGAADKVFTYGRMLRGDVPVVGDWDGNGRDDIAIIRDREWHLRMQLAGGKADRVFVYGRMTTGDRPVVGDWDGNGRDDIGVVRGDFWHLRNTATGGSADVSFRYGRLTHGDIPVTGDWDGSGAAGVGVVRDGIWYLRSPLSSGPATTTIPDQD